MYEAAMKDLAMEAKLLRTGREGNLPAIDPSRHPNISAQPVLQKLLPAMVFSALRHIVCPKAGVTSSWDQRVNALAGMLQALKVQTESLHEIQDTENVAFST